MSVSRDELEARRDALIHDFQLVVGHLQEIDYWLDQLDREADGPPPESGDSGPTAEE